MSVPHLGVLLAMFGFSYVYSTSNRQSDNEFLHNFSVSENAGHEDNYDSCLPLMISKLLQLVLTYPLLETSWRNLKKT